MARTTDDLISQLAAQAQPVARLRNPLVRAGLWIATIAIASGLGVYAIADMDVFLERAADIRHLIEIAATLATGILAVVAAFELSLPDRHRAWALLPVPALAVWIATAGLGCLRSWFAGTPSDLVESADCFGIIVAISLPLGLVLLWMLRKARPLDPNLVAAVGGLGVAGIAAFLLQFFHPFDVTVLDLAFHAAAVALIVVVSSISSRVAKA